MAGDNEIWNHTKMKTTYQQRWVSWLTLLYCDWLVLLQAFTTRAIVIKLVCLSRILIEKCQHLFTGLVSSGHCEDHLHVNPDAECFKGFITTGRTFWAGSQIHQSGLWKFHKFICLWTFNSNYRNL